MDQARRYCTACGRALAPSYSADVCPICKQAEAEPLPWQSQMPANAGLPLATKGDAPAPGGPLDAVAPMHALPAVTNPARDLVAAAPSVRPDAAYAASPPHLMLLPPHIQREIASIASLARADGAVWLVIAFVQILVFAPVQMLFGLFTLGLSALAGLVTAAVGVWNICAGAGRFRWAREIEQFRPGVPAAAERHLAVIVIFIFVNLFFGGVIGVAGCVFDLVLRDRILKVRAAFESPQAYLPAQSPDV
jgi:hypothetical protein